MIGAVALGALAVGGGLVLATSRMSSNSQAYQAPAPVATAAAPAPAPAMIETTTAPPVAAPATQTVTTRRVVRNGAAYRTAAPARSRVVVHKRSTKKSVAIIGGSTVGGAIVGGLVGGKKGAIVGGLVGGTAGTVYDRKTRKKVYRQ